MRSTIYGSVVTACDVRCWPIADMWTEMTLGEGKRLYCFGDVRVATLALLTFTTFSSWPCGVIIAKFSGHAVTFLSSPTVFADTLMYGSTSTRV